MRIITIRQPWAQLIALRVKTFETRSWSTKYRGPVLIHAGASDAVLRKLHRERAQIGDWRIGEAADGLFRLIDVVDPSPLYREVVMPLGAVVAVADITDCHEIDPGHTGDSRTSWPRSWVERPAADTLSLLVSSATKFLTDISDQLPYGNWEPGNFAWQLDNVRPLDEPIAWRGRQGLTSLRHAEWEMVRGLLAGQGIEASS